MASFKTMTSSQYTFVPYNNKYDCSSISLQVGNNTAIGDVINDLKTRISQLYPKTFVHFNQKLPIYKMMESSPIHYGMQIVQSKDYPFIFKSFCGTERTCELNQSVGTIFSDFTKDLMIKLNFVVASTELTTITKSVIIRTLTGRNETIPISLNDTLAELKVRCAIVMNDNLQYSLQYRIIFAGKTLEDNNKTLRDYNIKYNDTLHLVLCLRGGMYHLTSGQYIGKFDLKTNDNETIETIEFVKGQTWSDIYLLYFS